MKFWDSSGVVPLLVPEAMSRSLQELYDADPVMFAWWGTEIECTSAIARRQPFGPLREDVVAEARPSTLEFVSLDDRLLVAARREGFPTTRSTP